MRALALRGVKGASLRTKVTETAGEKTTPLGRKIRVKVSQERKAASALIANIPFPLAPHIARCFKPECAA